MSKVLVTAGANGIGLAIARAFHARGDQVCICDIDEAGLARAAAGMPGLATHLCDVGDRAAVASMVADAGARLGGLDVLVNRARIGGPTKPVHEYDPSAWGAVVRINQAGCFEVGWLGSPHLTL